MVLANATDRETIVSLIDELLACHDPKTSSPEDFLGAQFDAGLAWVHFPVGYGGLDASPALQPLIDERLLAVGAPDARARNPIGHGMSAPTVAAHGSDAQRRRYLRPLFTGEEVWCQLMSEPGAGSDVAALSSRAVPDGDEWVISGQKVWTSLAHIARFGTLVVRTDPAQPKHTGMTHFVIDMQAPGVEVQPLRQMTGDAEFNEIFLNDVRIPDSERLGDVGDGWRVALTTLMNERVSIGGAIALPGSGPIALALDAWRENGRSDPVRRDRLVQLWIEAEINRLTNMRAGLARSKGTPGAEGSVGKLASAELNKRIYEMVMELLGPSAMLYGSYEFTRPGVGESSDSPQKAFLRSRANSIEGGTSEVMRNILGERVLGLPGDVRVDKDLPWSQVPRS